MSFGEWAANQAKKSKFSGYDPKDYGTKYYRKEDYDKYNAFRKKADVLENIVECRDNLRSPYASRPSDAHMEKILTHALAEITNLRKKNERLEKELDESFKDIIEIKIGDETVIIDGDLATQVISSGVRNYITEALEAYCDAHGSED